tara:strand:- start:169 stop:891 length:723 start_codon:yes stop_codon:yes gene_type:complete
MRKVPPERWLTKPPKPAQKTTKGPIPGSVTGKKEAFMKRKTASDLATGPGDTLGDPAQIKEQRARQKALEAQKAKSRTKALYHGASQADASAGGDFGKLGGLPRRPIPRPQPEFSKKRGPGAIKKTKAPTPSQKEVISGAVAKQKLRESREEFTGEKEWRDPDKMKKRGTLIEPSLEQKRRGQYSANKRDEDERKRMEEEAEQYARKGGKITKKKAVKKSSTSPRSRPKNPTLQKTSYNY